MAKFHLDEIELCWLIFQDHECAALAVSASISKNVGVVLSQGGRPVGRWRQTGDRLGYHGVLGPTPIAAAASLEVALGATRVMARTKLWHAPLDAATGLEPI